MQDVQESVQAKQRITQWDCNNVKKANLVFGSHDQVFMSITKIRVKTKEIKLL